MDTHVDFNSTWAAPFQMFQTVEEDEELVHKEPVDKESEDEDPEGKKSEKRKKEKVLVYSTMSQGRGQPELRLFINYRVFGPQESPTKLALAITDGTRFWECESVPFSLYPKFAFLFHFCFLLIPSQPLIILPIFGEVNSEISLSLNI